MFAKLFRLSHPEDSSGFSLAPSLVKGEYPEDVSKFLMDSIISGGQMTSRSLCTCALRLFEMDKLFGQYVWGEAGLLIREIPLHDDVPDEEVWLNKDMGRPGECPALIVLNVNLHHCGYSGGGILAV